jgi:hypothetical protein
MIDYIKLNIKNCNIPKLLNKEALEFKRKVSEKTGELENKTVAEYHTCKITIYDSGLVVFSGSIHKMNNSLNGIVAPNNKDEYNGNQFYYDDFLCVKTNLVSLFDTKASDMVIRSIEYGYNLATSFAPKNFMTGLLTFEMKPFEFRFNEYFVQSEHSQYIVKIYDKGNQYDMPINILRVEIKVKKMMHQKKTGIETLGDINTKTWRKIGKYIEHLFKKILYYDNSIFTNNLSDKNIIELKDYSNIRYWQKISRQRRYRDKLNLNSIINQNSDNLKNEILKLINQE